MIMSKAIVSASILAMSSPMAASQCTLCEGMNTIPNSSAMMGNKSCLDASMESIFHAESSETCKVMRKEAKFVCGCEDSEESEEGGDIAADDEQVPPTSGADEQITSSPTSLVDKKPNCQDLIKGIYPFPESYAESLEIKYHAELMVDKGYVQETLHKEVIEKFEDSASRVVSAGAAGCYNRRRLGRTHTRSSRMMVEDHKRKIHYVKFFDLKERIKASCSKANRNDSMSNCFVVEGKINVIYTTFVSTNENQSWAEELLLDIFTTQSTSISNVVQEVTNYNNVQTALEGELNTSSTSLAIGLGAGLSVFVLIAGIFSFLFIKRRSSYSFQEKRRQRRANKFEKKIERVKIMNNLYEQSDDSSFAVEYVEEGFINGDDSISNAPTVEYKKVLSLADTIMTKIISYDDVSRDMEGQEESIYSRSNSHISINNSSSSSNSSNRDEEEEEYASDNVKERTQISFPLYEIEETTSVLPSILSENTPFDEAESYIRREDILLKQTPTSPLKFVNEDGHVVHNNDI